MSSIFTCMAYSDVEATIRLADNVVYLSLKDKKDNVHLTLNPAQALSLTQEMQVALSNMTIAEITADTDFCNMSVEVTSEDYEEDEMSTAVPF